MVRQQHAQNLNARRAVRKFVLFFSFPSPFPFCLSLVQAFPYQPFFEHQVEERLRKLPRTSDDRDVQKTLQAARDAIGSLNGPSRQRRRPAGYLGYEPKAVTVVQPLDFRSHTTARIDTKPPAGLAAILRKWLVFFFSHGAGHGPSLDQPLLCRTNPSPSRFCMTNF